MVHFDLTLALTPGNTYTARVVRTGGASYSVVFSPFAPYAGGHAFNLDGSAIGTVDLSFVEGLHAVPEPASLVLVASAAAAWCVRRRRQRA